MKQASLLAFGLLLIGAACTKQAPVTTTPNANTNTVAATNGATNTPAANTNVAAPAFATPKKSAHYESNAPAHGMIVAAVPMTVVIDFNFDLSTKSAISILKDDQEYGTGAATVDANKLALRRAMDPNSPDGTYTVKYTACWPDNSCHDGNFQFAIDRTRTAAYTDLRNQSAVTVNLKDIAFAPANIRISKGTAVTWMNDDTVTHYVNTDAHPAHTYYPGQNSTALKPGEQYTLPFDLPGIYPYHCSAHADVMQGSMIVE